MDNLAAVVKKCQIPIITRARSYRTISSLSCDNFYLTVNGASGEHLITVDHISKDMAKTTEWHLKSKDSSSSASEI